MSGAIQKFAMDGHTFNLTSDSDLSYVGVTRAVTESQMGTKGPHKISDLLVQKVTGQTGQWDMGSADMTKFEELVAGSVDNNYTCSFITAEGYKVNSATAYIVIPSVDGIWTSREGKVEFEVHCKSWSKPKKV